MTEKTPCESTEPCSKVAFQYFSSKTKLYLWFLGNTIGSEVRTWDCIYLVIKVLDIFTYFVFFFPDSLYCFCRYGCEKNINVAEYYARKVRSFLIHFYVDTSKYARNKRIQILTFWCYEISSQIIYNFENSYLQETLELPALVKSGERIYPSSFEVTKRQFGPISL